MRNIGGVLVVIAVLLAIGIIAPWQVESFAGDAARWLQNAALAVWEWLTNLAQ